MTYSDEVWCSSIIFELTTYAAPEEKPTKKKIKERQDLNLHFPCSTYKCREGNLNRNPTIAFYSLILLKSRTLTKENLKNDIT